MEVGCETKVLACTQTQIRSRRVARLILVTPKIRRAGPRRRRGLQLLFLRCFARQELSISYLHRRASLARLGEQVGEAPLGCQLGPELAKVLGCACDGGSRAVRVNCKHTRVISLDFAFQTQTKRKHNALQKKVRPHSVP